jgi:serine/threonine-protein kinase
MATVYEASDERLGRDVALKVMHPDLAEDEEFVHRFIAEARAAAALSRVPTIVTVFDQGASDGMVWLALELVRGRTLRRVIAERGRLDPRTALAVLEPVLAALATAHDAGIVHRDVKPENVLVGDDGHVQVADFGLAHAVTAAPHASRGLATRGMLLGTVAYISPEQALGQPATRASDVYAAGIMLYEMLTGHPPHDGPTDYVVVRKHVDEDVAPPSAEVPDVPAEIDGLVAMATARDPARRLPDATAFLGALRRTRRALDRDGGARSTDPVAALGAPPATPADADAAATTSDTNPIHHSTTALDPVAPDPDVAATVPPSAAPPAPADPFRTPPKPPKRRRRVGVRLAVVLALLAAMAGVWWWFDGRLVPTPTLVGMTVAQAEEAVQQVGLQAEVTGQEYSETIPADAVVASDPGAGARVAPGQTVSLVVSRGPERYQVPSLVGATRDEADQALAELTLVPGEVTEAFDEQVEQGRVITQDPAPGTEVKRAAVVGYVISKGREPIDVPQVVGQSLPDATAAIEGAQLSVSVGEAYSDDVPEGVVISQEPTAGTLFRGDTVSVVVSLGPENVQVPDVEDEDAEEAKAALESVGLTVRTITVLPAGPNEVLRQAPAAGNTVRVGSEVTIYVF